MDEIERLKKIVRDQTRMLQEKNRLLSEMEYRLKQSIVTGSRKEDLAKYQFQLSRDTIEGQASLLKTILGSIPFGLIVVNTKKQVISYNSAAQEMLEISGQEILGKDCSHVFGQACAADCLMGTALSQGGAPCTRPVTVQRKDKGPLVLSLNVAPIQNTHGALIGCVELFSDISEDVARKNSDRKKYDSMVRVMTKVMGKKDDYILAHSERVRNLSLKVAEAFGVSGSDDQRDIAYASLLHDIGLLSVPDEVLSAKGSGSGISSDVIRAHPVEGEWMLGSMEGFDEIKKIIRSHHEHFDGRGYPDGLNGTEIPLASRIIGVVEAYDAMCHDDATNRRSEKEIFTEIEENRGSQFDPDVVDIFLKRVVRNGE